MGAAAVISVAIGRNLVLLRDGLELVWGTDLK